MQHPLPEVFRTLFRQEKLAKEDGGLLFLAEKERKEQSLWIGLIRFGVHKHYGWTNMATWQKMQGGTLWSTTIPSHPGEVEILLLGASYYRKSSNSHDVNDVNQDLAHGWKL